MSRGMVRNQLLPQIASKFFAYPRVVRRSTPRTVTSFSKAMERCFEHVHNPPVEVDLDGIYYYRMDRHAGYAHQHLYTQNSQRDLTLTAQDGDVVLVRDGYRPVVAGHGYNIYYLNSLAGSARELATTEDPDHVWVRSTWNQVDPRVPRVANVAPERDRAIQ